MSLLERLGRTKKQDPEGRKEVLFPFSIAEEYLSSSPLVLELGVAPELVHRSFLDLERRPPSVQSITSLRRCFECRGILEVDAREGVEVCTDCGIVQNRASLNIVPEYVIPADRGTKRMRMSSTLLSRGEQKTTSSFWRDLAHYNIFTHLSEDSLRAADARLRGWCPPYGRNAALAASLLGPALRRLVPASASIRSTLERGSSLAPVEDALPVPRFPCAECKRPCFSRKDARWHCRLGWGQETRP